MATVYVYNPNGAPLDTVTQQGPNLISTSPTQVQDPGGGSSADFTQYTVTTLLENLPQPSFGVPR